VRGVHFLYCPLRTYYIFKHLGVGAAGPHIVCYMVVWRSVVLRRIHAVSDALTVVPKDIVALIEKKERYCWLI